tara:strand:- start:6367 stop:7614 length:1248 start_codon:yes stop_codon:yes gene_type:complete
MRALERIKAFPLLAVVLLMSSCQTGTDRRPTVSLEEARRVVANFEGSILLPPLRTIDDITRILDEQVVADPKEMERARDRVEAVPPADIAGIELVKLLQDRGLAARVIGDVPRQLENFKDAERLSRDADANTRIDILRDLSVAQILAGNFAEALRHREMAIAAVPYGRLDRCLGMSATISVQYARAGDLDTAEKRLTDAEKLLDESYRWRGFPTLGTIWTGTVARSRANNLDVRGQYALAENHYLTVIAQFEKFRNTNPDYVYGSLLVEATRAEFAENLLRRDRIVDAEIQARKALIESLVRHGRYSEDTALQLRTLVRVISAQGRAVEAERLARALVDIFEKIGAPSDSYQLAQARAELAETLVNQRRWKAALQVYSSIEEGLASSPATFEQFFGSNLNWACVLLCRNPGATRE